MSLGFRIGFGCFILRWREMAMVSSPAGMVALLDSLKVIKISELKTLRELETWLSAIDTAIQRNK